MGKRSDFERLKGDFYVTPFEAVKPLAPHLSGMLHYTEPCAGDGSLIGHIWNWAGLECKYACDIDPRPKMHDWPRGIEARDAMTITNCLGQAFITNPPWTREILHPLITHLSNLAPTWMIFDADWMHTVQARPHLERCMKIVSVGRVKWIAGSANTGKDNAAWYLFSAAHQGGPRFVGR